MEIDLTKGNCAKVIALFSIPIIIGNVFQQFYLLVDSIIVGRGVNYQALAGLGITNGLTFFITGFVMGVTSGMGICMAQCFGEKDMAKLKRSFAIGLVVSGVAALLLTLVAAGLSRPVLRLMGTGVDVFGYAYGYLIVMVMGIAAMMAYNMVACALRAIGDSRTPLYFLIFSSVLNVALDLLFILVFGWGVRGAALATVIAQGMSAVLSFGYAFRRYPMLRLEKGDFAMRWHEVRHHLGVGLPMALQFSIVSIGLILLQAALNDFPATYIAGFTASNKIQNIGALVAMSFGVAIANFAGQNYGAGNLDRVRRGVKATMAIVMAVCAVSMAVLLLVPDQLTSMFVDDSMAQLPGAEEIFFASRRYLFVSAVFFPFLYIIFIYRNVLQGMGRTFWPLMAGLLELAIRCAASFTLPKVWGYNGIVMIDMMAWVGAAVMLLVAYYAIMHKISRQDNFLIK